MHLLARDRHGLIITASSAVKHRDYECRECGGIVRVRGGLHRQAHFFHLQSTMSCRQNGKSLIHLQVQHHLQDKLGKERCQLEHRFEDINRIADVVWWTQNIVFEVQCSSISTEEITQRNADYASIGFHVVWILHDSRYNQARLTEAELTLQNLPHYYTNIDIQGHGILYDQLNLYHNGFRWAEEFIPLEINVRELKHPASYSNRMLPLVVNTKLINAPFCFEGDLMDRCLHEQAFCDEVIAAEKRFQKMTNPQSRTVLRWLHHFYRQWIARPYLCLFQMWLEDASRR